jgi:hypothetical protein
MIFQAYLLSPFTLKMQISVNFYHAPEHHIQEVSNVQTTNVKTSNLA